MNDSLANSLKIYQQLERDRSNYLTPAEQVVVRLGSATMACQAIVQEDEKSGRMEDYRSMERVLATLTSKLEIAIAKLG